MKILWKILVFLVVAGIAGVLVLREWRPEVLVIPATEGTAVNAVTGTVEIFANVDIHLKAEQRGVVEELKVKAGEEVEKGDTIAIQSSRDLKLKLDQVEVRLDSARARRELMSTHKLDLKTLQEEVDAKRMAVELEQAPRRELDRALRELEKKEAQFRYEEIQQNESVEVLEAQKKQLEYEISQMEIKAPFTGTVVSIQGFPGDLLSHNNNVVRLVSDGRYGVLELSEEDFYGVEEGQPVTLRLASYPDRTIEGEVSSLEKFADSGSKTRNVIVTVDAPESMLVPGLTGEGSLVKNERPGAVLIPRRALIGNRVYVVEGSQVEVREVKPGYLGLNKAEILEGIEIGDKVIAEGQAGLREGDRVSVKTRSQ